ncbi:MAG: hypothetical protein ACI8Z1_002591 [Candidatus Azotimanducaceae bacterium]|jgi:hypothetical protein
MDMSAGTPSPEQALRRPDWGVYVLVRPERSSGENRL